jgi:hypothetical protein
MPRQRPRRAFVRRGHRYASDLPAINTQLAHVNHEPTLIPVLQHSDENALREHYPLALNEDANINQFLKTIEQTMKARGT